MNYNLLYFALIDSVDFSDSDIKRLKLIKKVKQKAKLPPMNLSEIIQFRENIEKGYKNERR